MAVPIGDDFKKMLGLRHEALERWQKEVDTYLNLMDDCEIYDRPTISRIMHFETALRVPISRHVSSIAFDFNFEIKPPAEEIDYIVVDETLVKKREIQERLLNHFFCEKFSEKKFRRTKNIMKKRYAHAERRMD